MKNTLSPKLVSFANRVAKLPLAKLLLKPFYYSYKNRLKAKRNKAYRVNALNTLADFDSCMTENGFVYTLVFGSMLGAVRERGFIKHDLDIDVAMWVEDYTPEVQKCLESAGFKLDHRYLIDDGKSAREETYVKNDVSIDVYCIFPPIDDYPYICSKWAPVEGCITKQQSMKKYGYITGKRLEMPIKKSLIRSPFESLSLPIPVNADEVLAFYYGDDFMNPDPKWVESKEYPFRKPWTSKKAIYIEY